ncbi:MAG: hypothetical protein H0X41_09595 [Chitinophagaceae bacterium]|nr:hypothetical protein [Chitinophagaceae bacterium]
MFNTYFRTAIRQLLKNKIFSIINIVGLSTGLAGVLALFLLVNQAITANSEQKILVGCIT